MVSAPNSTIDGERKLTIGMSQHISILPISAQIVVKLSTVVGTVGARRDQISKTLCINTEIDVRVEQSKSAIPRTSTSQH